jgi:hypothetical protein
MIPARHAAEENTIRLALIGCGGRGRGAVGDALSVAAGPVKLHAMPVPEAGRDPVTEKQLRPMAAELDWRKQRKAWAKFR